MQKNKIKVLTYVPFFVCVVLALFLHLTPLTKIFPWLQVHWLSIVVIYWFVYYPQQLGLFCAFLLGIMLDLLTGSVFGSMGLCLALMLFGVQLLRTPLPKLQFWQQFIALFFIIGLPLLLHYWLNISVGRPVIAKAYIYTTFASTLTWIVLDMLLKPRYSRSFYR